jgi:hypothetical protein
MLRPKTEPVWYIQLDEGSVLIGGILNFGRACRIAQWIHEREWEKQ